MVAYNIVIFPSTLCTWIMNLVLLLSLELLCSATVMYFREFCVRVMPEIGSEVLLWSTQGMDIIHLTAFHQISRFGRFSKRWLNIYYGLGSVIRSRSRSRDKSCCIIWVINNIISSWLCQHRPILLPTIPFCVQVNFPNEMSSGLLPLFIDTVHECI